jgi:chemotaxis protein MotB
VSAGGDEDDGHKCPPVGAPSWMATMADMFSLLLTFFILLLSFSNMDLVKFRAMAESIQSALGVTSQTSVGVFNNNANPVDFDTVAHNSTLDMNLMGQAEQPAEKVVIKEISEHEHMASELAKVISEMGLEDTVTVKASSRGVLVQVQGQVFFAAGQADLKPDARPFLDEIARIIKGSPYNVSIEGHTDDSPIHTARFPSNWELSTTRAISALRYMVDRGGIDPHRLSSAGYADTRPVVPNDTAEHQRRNRRVEFVLFKDERETF